MERDRLFDLQAEDARKRAEQARVVEAAEQRIRDYESLATMAKGFFGEEKMSKRDLKHRAEKVQAKSYSGSREFVALEQCSPRIAMGTSPTTGEEITGKLVYAELWRKYPWGHLDHYSRSHTAKRLAIQFYAGGDTEPYAVSECSIDPSVVYGYGRDRKLAYNTIQRAAAITGDLEDVFSSLALLEEARTSVSQERS